MYKDKKDASKYAIERYHRRRKEAIVLLGGQCVKCYSKEHLEFDHVNPDDKCFTIAKMWSASKEKLAAELNKCQLLCKSCHKDKTYANTEADTCGTLSKYHNRKCRCDLCKKAQRDYMKSYNAPIVHDS